MCNTDTFEIRIMTDSYTQTLNYREDEATGETFDCEPYEHTTNYVFAKIYINNTEIKSFVDYFALFHDILNKGYLKPCWSDEQAIYSEFYPFTCSCGIAGCAGIHNGIFSKHRRYNVEWRIKEQDKDCYKFLPKQYFNFDKQEYTKQIVNVWKCLDSLPLDFTDGFEHPLNLHEGLAFIKSQYNYTGSILDCLD